MSLTPEQERVIASDAKQILCVAGAGSGKTKTLLLRCKRLTERGVHPSTIAIVTFTNDAARELRERWGSTVPLGYVGTLHGLMIRLIGRDQEFTVIDDEQATATLEEHCAKLNYRGTKKAIKEALGRLQSGALDPKAPQTEPELVVSAWWRTLRKEGLFTYNDILAYGLKAVEDWPQDKPFPYTALFVDEFQDSAPVDANIYEAMPCHWKFYVGDPKQSIYSFRGGSLMNLRRLMRSDLVEKHTLSLNFRSAPEVIQKANRLLPDGVKMICADSVPSGDGFTPTPSVKEGSALFVRGKTGESEVFDVAAQLTRRSGSKAVLLRTNYQVEEWAKGLTDAGHDVRKRTAGDLPEDWRHAKNVLSYLSNPNNDRVALWVIAYMHGDAMAEKERQRANEAYKTVNAVTFNVTREHGALGAIIAAGSYGVTGPTVMKLRAIADKFPGGADKATVTDLQFAMSQHEFAGEEVGEGITVTTYHASKGREFDVVAVPCLDESIEPSGRLEDLAEEARCVYVAVTRARLHLILSCTDRRRPRNFAVPKGNRKPRVLPHEPRKANPHLQQMVDEV